MKKLGGCWTRHDGAKEWYQNGKLHRDDGPAFIHPDGTHEWYRHGKLHREDGPAIEVVRDGFPAYRWFLHGKNHPFSNWLELVDVSDEEKVMLKLHYG